MESTKDEIICIEKEIKSREKKFQDNAALPINFVESIRQDVDNVCSELSNIVITVFVVEAVTQADCVICYHAMQNGVDGALANDGDFIAVAGKKMMLIKDFKIKRGDGNVQTNLTLMLLEALLSQLGTVTFFIAILWES